MCYCIAFSLLTVAFVGMACHSNIIYNAKYTILFKHADYTGILCAVLSSNVWYCKFGVYDNNGNASSSSSSNSGNAAHFLLLPALLQLH